MSAFAPGSDMPAQSLDRIVRPRSIAIVGASADPRAFGGFVQANLEGFGFEGQLHLVSRSSPEIRGDRKSVV